MQDIAGIRHRETFQRNYLDLLLEHNLIERTIPDKPRSRLQKYRLSLKGTALLTENPLDFIRSGDYESGNDTSSF